METSFISIIDLPNSKVLMVFLILGKTAENVEPKYGLASKLDSEFFS